MSISSISGNGAFYTRPVQRRENIASVDSHSPPPSRPRNVQAFENEEQPKLPTPTFQKSLYARSAKAEPFMSPVERLSGDRGNRALNTYRNIGSIEQQLTIKETFGIDVYA